MTIKTEKNIKKVAAKRVDIVSVKMVKESSRLYADRNISSPEQVVRLTRDFIEGSDREKFLAIYLNTRNEPVAIHTVAIGTLNACLVDISCVFRAGLLCSANSLVCVHCHPTGNPAPSNEDRKITQRLKEAGEILGITVLDHVIVGDNRYYSFKEEGEI